LRKYGYNPKRFGRVISAKERYVGYIKERSTIKNLGLKFINNLKDMGEHLPQVVNMILPDELKIIISPESKDVNSARWFSAPGFYPDAGWPDNRIIDRYSRIINTDDFPDSVDHWYIYDKEIENDTVDELDIKFGND
jgi:hypothetical protein